MPASVRGEDGEELPERRDLREQHLSGLPLVTGHELEEQMADLPPPST